jgi:hypothetical protein
MVHEDILIRVRKLLAVAEHPSTPPGEAEAAGRAAERLVAKYAVDEALLDAAAPSRTTPKVRSLVVDAPYATAKTALVGVVAAAYDVRAISHRGSEPLLMTLIGFEADLAAVDLLFTSLLLQATTAMRRERTRGRGFRRAFLIGFAAEVGDRLATAREAAVAQAGGTSTALALRDRARDVDAVVREQFPRLKTTRATVSDHGGLFAGRASGAAANLAAGRNQVNTAAAGRLAAPATPTP